MNNISIPKKLQVGGFVYTVKQGPLVNKELERCSDYGNAREQDLEVRIASNVPPQIRSSTFIHEVLHCVDAVYNNHQMTEGQIHSMSHGLLQVFEGLGVRFV